MEKVTLNKLLLIIETREPVGLFYAKEGKKWTAVDNCNGNAWTETFDTKEDCLEWLDLNKNN